MEAVPDPFASQLKMRQPMEFLVDDRQQGIEGVAVSAPPILQELCDFVGRLALHDPHSCDLASQLICFAIGCQRKPLEIQQFTGLPLPQIFFLGAMIKFCSPLRT